MIQIILLFILLVLLCYLYYKVFVYPVSYWEKKGVKCTSTIAIMSNKALKPVYDKYADERYFGLCQFGNPGFVLKDPELIKIIGVKEIETFTDHIQFVPEDIDPLMGKTLFQAKGQKWRELRPMLSPSFTSSKMKIMFKLMDKCGEQLVNYFQEKNEDSVEVDLKNLFSRYTNDVIASLAFGLEVNSLKDPKNEFYLMGREGIDFNGIKGLRFIVHFILPRIARLLKVRIIQKKTADYFSKIVLDTIKTRTEKRIVRPDFLQILLELREGKDDKDEMVKTSEGFSATEEHAADQKVKKELTLDDIVAQAMLFFLAGLDTTSTLMCFVFYELAINPDIQDKLRREIKKTREECHDKITYEALLQMKYLDMVVSETLRMYPPTSSTERISNRPYTVQPVKPGERPVELEAKTFVLIPMYQIHHDAKYYPDPEKFDPERFNDENKQNIKPMTYMPFGVGPRSCIGSRFALLETKILIYHVIGNFEVVPTKKSQIPLVLRRQFNLMPTKSFNFAFKKL